METIKNAINWFEIPVLNFDRAKEFYSRIFDYEMYETVISANRMGFLPMDPQSNGVGGAIVQGDGCIPSALGSRVYLNGGDDLQVVLSRVEAAGGEIIIPKTKIDDETGFFAIFEDSEGNHVGLHSMK